MHSTSCTVGALSTLYAQTSGAHQESASALMFVTKDRVKLTFHLQSTIDQIKSFYIVFTDHITKLRGKFASVFVLQLVSLRSGMGLQVG